MLKKSLVAVLALGSITAVLAQAPAFKRTVLQTMELSVAGREAVTAKAVHTDVVVYDVGE